MVNTDDFVKRIEIMLEYYGMSASVFADKMGVQRSGVSHLMSGRNKPSLDFVMKIIENFQEVDIYWLLNGTGNFPKKDISSIATTDSPTELNLSENLNLFSHEKESEKSIKQPVNIKHSPEVQKEIDRIVLFYKDGTFKNYSPEK